MKLVETDFKGLLIINHNVFSDNRGCFKEKFKKEKLEKFTNYELNFCQENSVKSNLNVLRGLHFQDEPYAQSKLVSVSFGKILDIAVDIRKDSDTYGKYFSLILSFKNNQSLFIPKGFAHGYLTLSEFAIINYSVDNYYKPDAEKRIHYEDDFLKIDWGIDKNKIITSKKDKTKINYKW